MYKFSAIFASIFLIACLIFTDAFADKGKNKNNNKTHQKKHQDHNDTNRSRAKPHAAAVRSIRNNSSAPVMAHSCPFSCATQAIPKSHCKDWREGATCFVQNLRANEVSYRVLYPPTNSQKYYVVELPEMPMIPSPGQAIGNSIDRAIGNIVR